MQVSYHACECSFVTNMKTTMTTLWAQKGGNDSKFDESSSKKNWIVFNTPEVCKSAVTSDWFKKWWYKNTNKWSSDLILFRWGCLCLITSRWLLLNQKLSRNLENVLLPLSVSYLDDMTPYCAQTFWMDASWYAFAAHSFILIWYMATRVWYLWHHAIQLHQHPMPCGYYTYKCIILWYRC